MNIEFLDQNKVATTTQLVVDSATSTAGYIFDRRPKRNYASSGFADDLTTTTIHVNFTTTQTVDRIAIQRCNWKDFTVYYNGTTSSLITLTTTCGTTSSDWTSNSAASLYLYFSPINATSVSFAVTATQVANEEKQVGQIIISELLFRVPRNPDVAGFDPMPTAKQVEIELSDGGTQLYSIANKFAIKLKWSHLADEDVDAFEDLYDRRLPMYYTSFPTGTNWRGHMFEVNWTGAFDFYKPSVEYIPSGWNGMVSLKETPA